MGVVDIIGAVGLDMDGAVSAEWDIVAVIDPSLVDFLVSADYSAGYFAN